MNKKITNILLFLMFVGAVSVALYALVVVMFLILNPEALKGQGVADLAPRLPLIIHAIFGGIALFTGGLQLISKFREKFPKANIVLRKIYYASVVISGIFGFYVALYAQGGLVNKIGFVMLDMLWIYSIWRAIRADLTGDMASFRIWIIRNYALTFAAVTLRIWIPVIWSFYAFESSAFNTAYATVGFLSWVPNILFVEWFYLNKNRLISLENIKDN